MYAYRLNSALAAISRDDCKHMRIITLDVGTIVRSSATTLPHTGLVDVVVNGEYVAMFMQDLEGRAERIQDNAAP